MNSFYDNKIVKKPWGYEYVVYRNKKKLCITLLKINYKKSTSLHCHPQKKSGFMLLEGKASFQLGLWKKKTELHKSPSKRMIARGLFHSIRAISKSGLTALEFETPVDKNDLVRFKDLYGRQQKSYEGKNFTQKVFSNNLRFNQSLGKNKKQIYKYNDLDLIIEKHIDFSTLKKNKKSTILAIIDGAIVDKNKREIISHGDVVRIEDIMVLSKVFKINKKLVTLKIKKNDKIS
jgi:mannose-6-phosphate isomerase-like protein (cupin superfamily)